MLNPPAVPHEEQLGADGLPPIVTEVAQFAVQCLFNSLGSIPIDYFGFSERDFHAELYHQCRLRFYPRAINRKFEGRVPIQNEIVLTSESGKTIATARDQHAIDINWTVPDLLFHDPVTLNSQWCAVEIKRRNVSTNEETIGRDLSKLNTCISAPLLFRHSVFILNNFSRNPLTVGHQAAEGRYFNTGEIIGLLNNVINVAQDHTYYLEIWVINPQNNRQNEQDPFFVLERSFRNPAVAGRPWITQRYARRGNRLMLNR